MTIDKQNLSFTTSDEIEYVRLASIKGRIKLESKGLKFRGGSTRSAMALEFNLTPRASHQKFIDAIQLKMDALLKNINK